MKPFAHTKTEALIHAEIRVYDEDGKRRVVSEAIRDAGFGGLADFILSDRAGPAEALTYFEHLTANVGSVDHPADDIARLAVATLWARSWVEH